MNKLLATLIAGFFAAGAFAQAPAAPATAAAPAAAVAPAAKAEVKDAKAEAKAQYEAAEKQYRSIEEANRVRLTEISHEAQAQIDKAQLDASNARKSSRRLLDAFSNSSPCTQATPSTAIAAASQAASAPEDLRAIVFSRIDDAAGIIAEYADKARIAGEACIAAYEVAR